MKLKSSVKRTKNKANILWRYYLRKYFAISLTILLKSITINMQIWSKFENKISEREARTKSGIDRERKHLPNNLKWKKESVDNCETISRGRFQIWLCVRKKYCKRDFRGRMKGSSYATNSNLVLFYFWYFSCFYLHMEG